MAFQPINFLQAQTQGSPLMEAITGELQKRHAEQMAAPQQAADLAKTQAQTGLLGAQAAKAQAEAQSPFGGKTIPGTIGEALNLLQLKNKFGESSDEYTSAKKAIDFKRAHEQSIVDKNTAMTHSLSYRLMPPDSKKQLVAYAVGMGYGPAQASAMFAQGKTLDDLSKEKGVKIEDVKPRYPLANENIKQYQQRTAAVHELDNLQDKVNEATKLMGRKFAGFSTGQLINAIKGNDPDQQAQMLAARMVGPDIANLRLRVAQGKAGVEAAQEMEEVAMSRFKVLEPMLSTEVRVKTNELVTQWLREANNSFGESLYGQARVGAQASPAQAAPGKATRTRMVGGREASLINGKWHFKKGA